MVRINKEQTGKQIEARCTEQGLKAKQLCELLDVETTTPYVWFNGKGMPQFDVFVKLCSILKCSMEDLIVFDSDEDDEYIPTADWRNSNELKEMLASGATLMYDTDTGEFMIGGTSETSDSEEQTDEQ